MLLNNKLLFSHYVPIPYIMYFLKNISDNSDSFWHVNPPYVLYVLFIHMCMPYGYKTRNTQVFYKNIPLSVFCKNCLHTNSFIRACAIFALYTKTPKYLYTLVILLIIYNYDHSCITYLLYYFLFSKKRLQWSMSNILINVIL